LSHKRNYDDNFKRKVPCATNNIKICNKNFISIYSREKYDENFKRKNPYPTNNIKICNEKFISEKLG